MTYLSRIGQVKRLWELVIPQVPPPDADSMLRWVETFTDKEIERAISRTSQKTKNSSFSSPGSVHRFTTGVMVGVRKNAENTVLKFLNADVGLTDEDIQRATGIPSAVISRLRTLVTHDDISVIAGNSGESKGA